MSREKDLRGEGSEDEKGTASVRDWYVVAGVSLQETAEGTNVKVIAHTSRDISLIGPLGDTTSASWPQLILSHMREFIAQGSGLQGRTGVP
jgi:hypothetical protein